MPDWERDIKGNYETYSECVIFVESPPGAGKTHLMEQILAREMIKRTCVRVDCSNDELVERAMEAVLSSHFPEVRSCHTSWFNMF